MYGVLPAVLMIFPWTISKAVFLDMVTWPPFVDLTKPDNFGLINARNFYLDVTKDSRIGVWYIPPASEEKVSGNIDIEKALRNNKPIIIYLHGTSNTRGAWHRVELYKKLVSLDYHVFAFDYRGYADALGYPTEDGIVQDSHFIYKWIKKRCGSTPVILWGHSLGSGIAVKLAKTLAQENDEPHGIVLEAPFTNIREAAMHHFLSKPFRILPFFNSVFLDKLDENEIHFKSDESVHAIKTSLLILHAEDDESIPYFIGRKLYDIARQQRPTDGRPIIFQTFDAARGYGHKYMFRAPELTDIIRAFVSTCVSN